MASPLERLPLELLNTIIDTVQADLTDYYQANEADEANEVTKLDYRVGYNERLTIFSAISRTSKALHHASLPFLYQEYRLERHLKQGRLRMFLRTLCQNPSLVRHVKALRLLTSSDPGSYLNNKAPPLEPKDIELFQPAMQAFRTFDVYDSLLYSLHNGCYVAELIILISLATNLECLQISVKDRWLLRQSDFPHCPHCLDPTIWFDILFSPDHAAELPRDMYPGLRTVMVDGFQMISAAPGGSTAQSGIQYTILAGLLQIPSLERLTTRGVVDSSSGGVDLFSRVQHNASIIAHEWTGMNTAAAVQMIDSSKRLDRLTIQWGAQRYMSQPLVCTIDVARIENALGRHRDSLQWLCLVDGPQSGQIWEGQARIDLSRFSRLSYLHIDEGIFIGSSNVVHVGLSLPSALRRLEISCHGNLDDVSHVLRAICSSTHDLLTEVIIGFWQDVGLNGEEYTGYLLTHVDSEPDAKWTLRLRDWTIPVGFLMETIEFVCRDQPMHALLQGAAEEFDRVDVLSLLRQRFSIGKEAMHY